MPGSRANDWGEERESVVRREGERVRKRGRGIGREKGRLMW